MAMSAFTHSDPPDAVLASTDGLPLTGERTVPGLDEENYWFRRHEVVYERLLDRCADRVVLEAGSGEGYGADLIAGVARHVIGLDYDDSAVGHVRARYPRVDMRNGLRRRQLGRRGDALPQRRPRRQHLRRLRHGPRPPKLARRR